MQPFIRALALFPEEYGVCFGEHLEFYLANGYVLSTPDFFAMLRPVWSHAGVPSIAGLGVTFPNEIADCWYIHAIAGKIDVAIRYLPYDLPLMCWHRQTWAPATQLGNSLRYYKLSDIRKRLTTSST